LQHGTVRLFFEQYPSPSEILSFFSNNPPHLQFFPFLCTTIPAGFHDFSHLIFGAANHFFFPAPIQRRQQLLCQLQNDMKKGTLPSSNGWDFIPNIDG